MPGPWDNYASPTSAAPPAAGPWQNYQPPAPGPSMGDYAADGALSLGTGIAHGASGIAGLPGLAAQGAVHAGQIIPGLGLRWSTPEEMKAGHGQIIMDPGYQDTVKNVDKYAPTPSKIDNFMSDQTGITLHKPTTGFGRAMETAGDLTVGALPMVATGGGSLAANALKAGARYVAAPTLASVGLGALGDLNCPQFGDAGRAIGSVVGTLGGAASEKIPQYIEQGGQRAAQRTLRDIVSNDGRSPAEIKAELAAHPQQWPADVIPDAKTALLGTAILPGPGKTIAIEAAKARSAAMQGMAVDTSNAAMGMPVSAVGESKRLADVANDNARTGFATALTGAGPVIVEPVIAKIDSLLGGRFVNGQPTTGMNMTPAQAELIKIRDSLTGDAIRDPNTGALLKPPNPQTYERDPMALHQLQSQIRVTASNLASSPESLVRQYAKPVGDIRQALINEIDTAAGGAPGTAGPYRQAQKQYADDKAVQDAYAKGWQFDKKPQGLKGELTDSPEALQQWWDGANDPQKPWLDAATPDEKAAFQAGARARQAQIQGTNTNALRQGKAPTDTDYGTGKLGIAFGPDAADQMAGDYGRMRSMAETNNLAMNKGSPTAERLAGVKFLQPDQSAVKPAASWGLLPQLLTANEALHGSTPLALAMAAGGASLGVGRLAAAKIGAAKNASARQALAEALTASGPEAQRVIDEASRNPGPTRALAEALIRRLPSRGDIGLAGSGVARPLVDYSQPSQR